ncbi:hypothetical protein LguiB_001085 [Lonicera macranthoides]
MRVHVLFVFTDIKGEIQCRGGQVEGWIWDVRHVSGLSPPSYSSSLPYENDDFSSSYFTFMTILIVNEDPSNAIFFFFPALKYHVNPNLSPLHAPNVAEKLPCLVFEFRSLLVPIDRVKRFLQYADIFPPFEELGRVWLEVKMDEEGKMRFKVDSDSEITKGFCSCLIWLLDGAAPGEVLEVKKEDLWRLMWDYQLILGQKRIKDLVEERYLESFPCLVTSCDDRNGKGTYSQAQV